MSFWKCFSCLRFPTDESVTILDYCNGTLSDVPPDVSQFERTLEELYLSSNRISDLPPELFYCQGIRVLKINDNELEALPNAIGSLRQLQTLDLSRNALTFIPDNIKSCKHLTHLDLSLNNLQRLPDAITSLISLQELFLNETYLEFLPANFGRLVNLKILELRSNNLITLPKSMARLTNLIRIDLGANEFTELPEVVGQLTQLRELWIDYNRIRRISANISNLRELLHFEANSNQLTSLPNQIGQWRNLEVLSLSTNELQSLPDNIGMLSRLVTLKCESNQLKELPDSICKLENLEEIMIDHNFIMQLPNTIGLLRKMRFLAADENLLRYLPPEICSCTDLSVLSLRGNQLQELPQEIGHLSNLRVLNLVNNAISYLPVSILNLTQLTALWISDNQSQPLVPLQYLDNITKCKLTCFMLPQTFNDGEAQNNEDCQNQNKCQQEHQNNKIASSEYSDNGSIASWPANVNQQQQQVQLQQQQFRLQQQQCRNQSSILSQNNTNSPSRRICFAEESTVKSSETISTRLMRSPTPYPKDLRLMAKHVKNMNNGGYRDSVEMVSPQQPADGHSIKIDDMQQASLHIKEARVLSNASNARYALQEITSKQQQLQQNQPLLEQQQYLQAQQPQHLDDTINCDIPDVQTKLIDTGDRYCYETAKVVNGNREREQNYIDAVQNNQNNFILDNSHDIYDGHSPLPMVVIQQQHEQQQQQLQRQQYQQHQQQLYDQQIHQQQQQHQQLQQYYQNCIGYPNNLEAYNNILYEQEMNWKGSNYDIGPPITSMQMQQNQQSQAHLHPQSQSVYEQNQQLHYANGKSLGDYAQRQQPPPYHIAKAYTKKSREDLLNFDTIRNQTELNSDSSGRRATYDEDALIMETNCHSTNNMIDDNFNKTLIEQNGNNNYNGISPDYIQHTENRIEEILFLPSNTITNRKSPSPTNIAESKHDEDHLITANGICNETGDNVDSPIQSELSRHHSPQARNTESDLQIQQSNNRSQFQIQQNEEIKNFSKSQRRLSSSSTSLSTQWLFGRHTNPTVKQLIVKKDPHLDFEIKKVDDQSGVFVATIISNTSAGQLLRVGDKILDIDGVDFTKIDIDDANNILSKSGPTLNIMVSRK